MNKAFRAFDSTDSDPAAARLLAAGITAPGIMEPAEHDPRLQRESQPAAAQAQRPSVLAPTVAGTTEAAPDRPAPRALPRGRPGDGLRLIPLSGFHWGGATRSRTAPPAPRVRGDHVLIRPGSGMVTVQFPRHNRPVTGGRLAFIPAGTAFSLKPPPDVAGQALLIPPDWFRDQPLPRGFRCGLPAPEDAGILGPAILALAEGAARHPGGDEATRHQLGLIAVALSRLEDRPGRPEPRGDSIAEARPLTERFLQLARQELDRSQTIAEMAGRLGCTQAHLDRACRQSRGRGALDLLYDLRLQAATEALRASAKPIPEIAEELGYAGLGHFMRAFQAATGRTPEAYRALMRDARGVPPGDPG
ncbi:AraC family transcriptional regulator [Paracoccus sp. MA]|uniref:helix-turn-helix transcriptional regulator n=1 Tax=Paracoccus sp. MA TaxID=2895796 RepID=UPI001E5F455C|nr:AraC family transcriptional regulator [Paracoccus sp. MA]UFM63514.1 AraC family transcriptional regulator [Paracoccus sp. MA]